MITLPQQKAKTSNLKMGIDKTEYWPYNANH